MDDMSPTTRKRKKVNFVPHVLKAVKMLSKGKDHGASRQAIIKFLEGNLNDKGNSATTEEAVKSAILAALDSGLLVNSTGVGLNGSFMLSKKSEKLLAKDCDDNLQRNKRKAVNSKEAKLRNISSLANEYHEGASQQNKPSKMENSSKRKRNTKRLFPSGDLEFEAGDQFGNTENTIALKTIMKPSRKGKFAAKLKRKAGSKKVKFRSPAKVILISPCIKKRSKRKK